MRRWISAFCAAVMLLLCASCSIPFLSDEPTEAQSSVEPSFVITTYAHSGLEKMMDGVKWYDNTVCAVQYIGSRENYAKKLETLRRDRFSQIDSETMAEIKTIDAGGNDVFLFVPRFDLERFSVFNVSVDAEEKAHVLRQAGEADRAFLLICDAGEAPNAQVNVTITSVSQNFRMVVRRESDTQTILEDAFQPIKAD